MSKRVFIFLGSLLLVSALILFLIFWRINPYSLNEKEILFFLFWCFIFLFSLSGIVGGLLNYSFLRRSFILGVVIRRAFFISFYIVFILALKIFDVFNIPSIILLGIFFLLLDFYFKS